MCNRFVESKVRTNKLYCSYCNDKIKIGEKVIFELNEEDEMENVYCNKCKENYEDAVDIEGDFFSNE